MRHPGQHLLVLVADRAPWLLPAVGLAVFVHKHFISYQGQGSAAAKAKASSRPRPPKLRRALKKAKSAFADTVVDIVDYVADGELERLEAVGLSSDKLMEWFTEDEVEALQQAQANQTAVLSLLSGTRFMADEHFDASDEAHDWYTDQEDEHLLQDLDYNGYHTHNDSVRSSDGVEFQIKPLSESTQALSSSPHQHSAGTSPDNQQQQQWQAARQLLQQLADHAQQEQRSAADVGSESSAADYFDPSQYYGLSPAANQHRRASLDMLQGRYLPRTGAHWASSYPPHLDELDSVTTADEEDEYTEPGQLQTHIAGRQLGPHGTNPESSNERQQQQQQQQREQSAARWLAEYAPPTPNFQPEFDLDYDFDYDYDYDPDFRPDFMPDFDDELGFDQLDAAFTTAAAAHA